MTLEQIEYVLFIVIVGFQIASFIKTRRKIEEFNKSVPEIGKVLILDIELTDGQIESFISNGLLGDIENYRAGQLPSDQDDQEDFSDADNEDLNNQIYELPDVEESKSTDSYTKKNKIRIVGCSRLENDAFAKILNALNKYLVRNNHSVADFNLIKDIVERNTDTIEEEVHLTLSTPLYLGLMGTMIGIVIGLFNMSALYGSTISDMALTNGIGILLGSVKVAMIASFAGLLLTIYNSSITFRGTKSVLEGKKNDFYTFIQVELLPTLNQGIGSTFESLQRNLSKFNEKFDTNLDRLSLVFDKNYESIQLQKQLLEQLDRNKVSEMTKYNVQILKELNVSVGQFEKFNSLFANVNQYLNGTYKLTDKTNELLERTGNFETIANSISDSIVLNVKLTDFLTSHFVHLENHKHKVDEAVVNIEFGIKDTFEKLKESLQESSQNLSEEATLRNSESRKVFESFTEELKSAFISQTEAFNGALEDKKSNLDYLKHLEPLLSEVKSYKNANSTNNSADKLYDQIVELNGIMSSSNQMLKHIEEDVKTPLYKKLFQIK